MALSIAGVNLVVNNVSGAIGAIVSVRRQLALLAGQSTAVSRSNRLAGGSATTLASAFNAPSRAVTTFGNSIKNLGVSLNRLGAAVSAVGFRMSFLISLPVASAFAGAAKAASEFETTLVRISTLTDLGGQSISQLSQDLLRLAPIVGIPANELAEGLFVIASAGERDAARAMDILTSSAKASAVGLGETEVVARAVTAIMSVYGDEVKNASAATDLLVATVREGNVEADRLAPSLGRVLAVMDSLGLAVNEGLAFIATFTRSGISAEEAITSLRGTLTTILRPTNAAQEALSEAGISIQEIRAAIADPSIGLSDTLIGLRGALEAAGLEMSDVFGNVRALAGVLFTTGDAAESFRQTQEAIANSVGDTEEAFRTVSQTTAFQFQQLKANASVLAVTFGTILLPAINEIINRIKPVLAAITEFALAHPRLVLMATGFALVAAAIGPLLIVFGTLISSVATIVTGIGGFIALIGAAISPIGLLATAVLGLATALGVILAASLDDIARKTNTTFANIAQAALAWGRNITVSLARGIIQGIVAVVRALIQVGNVIRSWLQANSPPRLLPDLENWGAAALTSYMQGWLQGDFSVFNDLAGIIENFLRSTGSTESMGGVIGAILGSRELVAQAVNEIRTIGEITTATLTQIGALFGDSATLAIEYADALADVQAATAEIARINQEFESIASPINEELESIADRREEIEEQKRIEELQSIIDDKNAPALAKELALMELREIELRNQLELAEENRDVALEAAEAEQQAAQQRLDIAKQLLEITIQQNELFKELTQTLQDLGGAGGDSPLEELGDDLGGAGGGLSDFLPGALPPLDELGLGALDEALGSEFVGMFEGVKEDVANAIGGIFAEIQPDIDNLIAGVETLGDVWSDVFLALPNAIARAKAIIALEINTIRTNIILAFNELKSAFNTFVQSPEIQALIDIFTAFRKVVEEELGPVFEEIKRLLTAAGLNDIINILTNLGGLLVFAIRAFVVGLLTMLAIGLSVISGIVTAYSNVRDFIIAATGVVEKGFILIGNGIRTLILAFTSFELSLAGVGRFLLLLFQGILEVVIGIIQSIVGIIITGLGIAFVAIGSFIEGVIDFFVKLYNELVGASIIPDLIAQILKFFGELPGEILATIQAGLGALLSGLRSIGESIIGAIIEGIQSGIGFASDLINSIGGGGTTGGGSTPGGKGGKPPGAQGGGIFSGPQSGYPVMLHGREAVIPLGKGRISSAPMMSGGLVLQSSGGNSFEWSGTTHINNGMDRAVFETSVRRIVKQTLRGN